MAADADTIRGLISRLEAGDTSRELDSELELVAAPGEVVWVMANYTMDLHPVIKRPDINHVGGFSKQPARYISTSVDAAIAFAEAVLPGCLRCSGRMEDGPFATIVRPMPGGGYANGATPSVTAASEPVALVLATLKAKLAETKK